MSRTFTRTPQACSLCRRRKTKCDGVRPRCGHCRSKNLECEWPAPEVQAYAPPTAPPTGPLTSPLTPSSFDPTAGSVIPLGSPSSPSVTGAELSPEGLLLCLDLFFERHFASDFCSFDHQPDFEQKCRQDPLLASSVVALCGRYLGPQVAQSVFGLSSAQEVSKAYGHKARFLAKMSSDEPSVAHVQGNLILAMAELLSNSGSRHWLFSGIAIRMAEIMRLNKEFHQKHSLKEQEIRRRTFWACLLFDRALAYLLGKHRTLSLETVTIAVPGTDSSLAYQDESRGVTLGNLSAYRRPSDLGVHPYLIKTVCVWSDMADFANSSRRQVDPYPPTDLRSMFFIRNSALQSWIESLPAGLAWSPHNYDGQAVLGKGRSFTAMHFLLCSASCVALQCYLPHITLFTKLVDLVDAAGLSYLHRDPQLIEECVSNAFKVGDMLQFLVSTYQRPGKSPLQSVWVACSVLIVANTFLWLRYAEDEICTAPNVRERANHYFDLVHQLISSWGLEWKAARQWLTSLDAMHDLYKAAYLGEVHDGFLGREEPGAATAADDDESGNDFRPQPGDGFPSIISLPNLQSSVKFATSDTSAKSISLQSIWLQLSGGWHYGFPDHGSMFDPEMGNQAGLNVVNDPISQ